MESHLLQPGFDWALFFSTFTLIFLAELPDKTAVAIVILASRHHPMAVFTGVSLAFVVQNTVAVLCGSVLSLLPPHIVHVGSGILFLVFAFLMWFRRGEKEEEAHLQAKGDFWKIAWTSFVVIFIAEWGDLTQLAAATLVAKTHRPLTIFIAATLALWSTTALGVWVGHHAKKALNPALLQKIAAVAFGIVGILLLSGFWDK
ncbi:MAG TPA: TMEM165/GDT1 family protein [bacterium]|jgi:putative Ca2+/H+ antiporter (TMEM165/GDT1 family)|nr:TMEM165/GDT1 family protein [bacterium]